MPEDAGPRRFEKDYLTQEELRAQVLATVADPSNRKKLLVVAALRAGKMGGDGQFDAEPNALVNEAVARVLGGQRKSCPRDLPILKFLAGVIKSLVEAQLRQSRGRKAEEFSGEEAGAKAAVGWLSARQDSPEEEVTRHDYFRQLWACVADDEDCQILMLAALTRQSKAEVIAEDDWTHTRYDNAYRRLMRRRRELLEDKNRGEKP